MEQVFIMEIFEGTRRPGEFEVILLRKGGDNWSFLRESEDMWHYHAFVCIDKGVKYRIARTSMNQLSPKLQIDRFGWRNGYECWHDTDPKKIRAIGFRTIDGIWLCDNR